MRLRRQLSKGRSFEGGGVSALSALGEAGLIKRIAGQIKLDKSVLRGVGDDCAVIRLPREELLLLTVDMLIEGVHFRLSDAAPYQIGWKALACGISDIAAMGGVAKYAVVSLGLPRRLSVDFVDAIYRGLNSIGRRFGINLVGGDTNSSDILVVDVAVLGFVKRKRLVTRGGAKLGDIICVTGALGGSYRSGRHLRFMPRLKEARALTAKYRITSMIDISDGLSTDLNHITEESGVGACIYEELIPVSRYAGSTEAALNDGEDFELLFTLPLAEARRIRKRRPSGIAVAVTQIGEVVPSEMGVNIIDRRCRVRKLEPRGYGHF